MDRLCEFYFDFLGTLMCWWWWCGGGGGGGDGGCGGVVMVGVEMVGVVVW